MLLATQAGPRTTSKIGITVGVQNLGPAAADGVQVTIVLPELGLRLADEGSGGCRQPDPTSLVCDWPAPLQPSSAPQFSAELTRGRLAAGDVASFAFSVASTTADPNLANNTSPLCGGDLPASRGSGRALRRRIVKPQDDAELASSQVRVELAVENKGPIAVTMVNFALSLPADLSFVSGQGGYGHRGEVPSFVCAIDDPAAVSCWSLPGTMPPGRTDVDRHRPGSGARVARRCLRPGGVRRPADVQHRSSAGRRRGPVPADGAGPAPATSTPAASTSADEHARHDQLAAAGQHRTGRLGRPSDASDPGPTRAMLPVTGGSSAPPVAAGLAAIAGGLALALVRPVPFAPSGSRSRAVTRR